MSDRRFDPLREAACLAHTIPGVALRLRGRDGRSALVSHACLGADVDPCRLRALLLSGAHEHLTARFDAVDYVTGIVHVGGGLFQRTQQGSIDERWFVTALDHERVVELLGTGADGLPDTDRIGAVVKPDPALGVTAVCIRPDRPSAPGAVDEVAMWALSACVVDELLAVVATEPQR